MKNRKFIKKIIFSLLLLLCVCVPFLVHKNNVNAQTEITDLTGTTWTFNETLVPASFLSGSNYTYEVNFTTPDTGIGTNFTGIRIGVSSTASVSSVIYLYEPEATLTVYSRSSWGVNDSYRTITFTDGFDITDEFLVDFITTNATLVGGDPEPDPVYTISGQYQFNEEITWLYDISEEEGVLYLPFYVYNLDNSNRVNYDYMVNKYNEVDQGNDFLYANETASGTFFGQVAGFFTTSTTIRMRAAERIIYFYSAEVSELVYNWLIENGEFINDPALDPNNPDNPDSDNNPNNPNNPDFGTDTVRQIVNQVNAFLGIRILPGLSFRDILLICIALPLLIYILKVFLGG